MPYTAESLGARLRAARERMGWTQEELAKKSGFSAHQIVSQIELGQREVKASELFRIAGALHLDLSSVAAGESTPAAVVLWRKKSDETPATREARFLERCRRYHSLSMAVEQTAADPLPQYRVAAEDVGYAFAEDVASRFGALFDLGPCPASSLAEVLTNRFDVQLWHEDLGDDGSAACVRGDFGAAVMINAGDAPWRRNFDLAHELFHLVTWDALSPDLLAQDEELAGRAERCADVFASNLLLPADVVGAEIDRRRRDGGVKWADLIDIARTFEVSTEALLWRLKSLRRVTADQVIELKQDESFRKADRASRSGSWWQPAPFPERFVRRGFLASMNGYLSRARLAEFLDTNLAGLPGILAAYGLQEDEDYQRTLCTA
jgi:XRE family transcriptional regulator, fatty acid utilization regulator